MGETDANNFHTSAPSRLSTPERRVISGVLWIALYLLFTLLPLAIIGLGPTPAPRGVWREFSVALGFVGLAMMGLQFVLTARFRWLNAPYGTDVMYAFHRHISLVATALILAHPGVLLVVDTAETLRRLNPLTPPWAGRFGVLSVVCLLALIATSVWRLRLRIPYETWRRAHGILAVAAVSFAIFHILLAGVYLDTPLKRILWLVYSLAWLGLIAYVRLIKPFWQVRTPYRVVSVAEERGRSYTLAVEPEGHAGMRFRPGQFAWLTARDSPFAEHEHPYSISSSAEHPGRLQFTIKVLGDFSEDLRTARPGERIYLDGPYGALSADRYPDARGFVLVAGGIGITPMISHLRTFADRRDPRPVVLFYANNNWDEVTFREELERLPAWMNLKVVHVLTTPPEGWTGETGYVTKEILAKHLPADRDDFLYFICGPGPMMDAVEAALHELGAPVGSMHAERFNLV